MNLDRFLFRKIANTINKNGGITLNQSLIAIEFEKGYLVSLVGIKRILPCRSLVSSHDVEVCLKELGWKIGILGLTNYVGFWKDDVTLYADYTIKIDCKLIAIIVGLVCKQKAIWDCKRARTIYL